MRARFAGHEISVNKDLEWAIGIYAGDSPLELCEDPGIGNPVLTKDSVTDIRAEAVCDPFIIREGPSWHMFFEAVNTAKRRGEIGTAASADGVRWTYGGIVLAEPFHLSYPCVFAADGRHYLLPESARAKALRLYEAQGFPHSWRLAGTLMEGEFTDATIFCRDGMFWILACTRSRTHDELRLYFAERVQGPWRPHPCNPIVTGNAAISRPAGRVVSLPGAGLLRYAQDDRGAYGRSVRAFRITELTTERYHEEPARREPVITAHGEGWARHGMHHVDPVRREDGRWLAAVDGYRKRLTIRYDY